MIFGKYINRYYLKHAPVLLLGLAALLTVDYIQLLIPQLYRLVINGVNLGQVVVNGETLLFTKEVLLQARRCGSRQTCGSGCSTTAAGCPSSTIR